MLFNEGPHTIIKTKNGDQEILSRIKEYIFSLHSSGSPTQGLSKMKNIAHLLCICIILISSSSTQAYTVMLSNGLDGAFAPDSSMLVAPDEDGVFHFTTINIPEQALISFDRSSWEGEIYLLATGDINIYGALNTGPGSLHLYTSGAVTIGGKVYGDTITIAGEEVHYINNPNGNPDEHLFGGVYTTIQPDGELELLIPDTLNPTFEIDARDLTAGLTMTSSLHMTMDAITFAQEPSALLLQTPLPPAIWLLLSAIAVFSGFGRNKGHRAR